MTTVADFVKDTLGCLQLVSPNQPVKPADMQTAIRFLNRFMERTEANSIATGWSPVSSPSDVVPLPPEAELGVMYSLAMVLAPQWGVSPLPEVAAGASMFMADLIRDQAVATPIRPIIAVPVPSNTTAHSGGLVAGGIVG
jgi:hypothetical protein